MGTPGFASRWFDVRAKHGPLVFGLDPSAGVLRDWGFDDTADGLERFVDVALEGAAGAVGVVKPQSAFYERHGWRGARALTRLVADARSAELLVLLDVKRGDIGSTNEAYAAAYLGDDAAIPADAITLAPYLGLGAMGAFFERAVAAAAGLFVVIRSSNPEGRRLQESRDVEGRSVEQQLVAELRERNDAVAPDGVGPFGAVMAATREPPRDIDLRAMNGLFLAPGLGAQGSTIEEIAECFAACPDRVLASASRSLLAAGPDRSRLRDEVLAQAAAATAALGGRS
jgi:orotidine-5'-phosphate decarboxylase